VDNKDNHGTSDISEFFSDTISVVNKIQLGGQLWLTYYMAEYTKKCQLRKYL